MRRILILMFLLAAQAPLFAQNTVEFDPDKLYSHEDWGSAQSIRTFSSVGEADRVIRSILSVVGLKPNFKVRAADIANAAAVIYEGERYILYDRDFIQSINNASSTSWAGISILAHEIGHHLNGHTLHRGGSNPADELDADEFSGFVLRKLGANLEEAQAAMSMLSEEHETATHPERNRRLSAIARGWQNGGNEHLAQEFTIDEPQTEVMVPQRQESTQVLASQYILSEVRFTDAPQNKFYITTNYNLVGVNKNKLVLYGKLQETNSSDFPYILTDEESAVIYVARDGSLFDADGEKVGYMLEHQG